MSARACTSCNKSSSSPHNFILTCLTCSTHWHHRCHNPVVSDNELIKIINALTKGRIMEWNCGRCKKGKGRADQPFARGPPMQSNSNISAHNENVGNASHPKYMLTDDDNVMIIDDPQPSSAPALPHSGTSSIPHPVSTAVIDLTLSSDEDESVLSVQAPRRSPTPPTIAQKNTAPQTAPGVPVMQIPHNPDPVPVIAQASNQNESDSFQVPSQQDVNRPPVAPPVKANLAPTWFRERWAASVGEVDTWQRARQKKTEAHHRDPRRKIKSTHSGDYSGDLFHFFASMWLDEQKKVLIEEGIS